MVASNRRSSRPSIARKRERRWRERRISARRLKARSTRRFLSDIKRSPRIPCGKFRPRQPAKINFPPKVLQSKLPAKHRRRKRLAVSLASTGKKGDSQVLRSDTPSPGDPSDDV